MNSTLGRLKGELAEPIEATEADLIDLLNENIKPPQTLNADEVFIRAMFIISDEVNSYGGRFPSEEHERLAELLVDSPVLVGHRQDKLPVGRNFHARLVEREGKNWIKSYFYWLKSAEGAESLLKNLDGGVYKECSIGFTFRLPECSICGKDIRLCEHEPFEKYATPGGEQTCHFLYRQIEKVLETSLVYRGAIPDTSITRKLTAQAIDLSDEIPNSMEKLNDLSQLVEGQYLIIPAYDSLAVMARSRGDCFELTDENDRAVNFRPRFESSGSSTDSSEALPGRLVGFRGKQRCSEESLRAYLAGRSSQVSRVQLMLLPSDLSTSLNPALMRSNHDVRLIPFRLSSKLAIENSIREVMTRDGVELWPVDGYNLTGPGFRFCFGTEAGSKSGVYHLNAPGGGRNVHLIINHPQLDSSLTVRDFEIGLAQRGRGFVAVLDDEKAVDGDNDQAMEGSSPTGRVLSARQENGNWQVRLAGVLAGEYLLRPIRLSERACYLFTRKRTRVTP